MGEKNKNSRKGFNIYSVKILWRKPHRTLCAPWVCRSRPPVGISHCHSFFSFFFVNRLVPAGDQVT